jgi:MoxR-like ATPase
MLLRLQKTHPIDELTPVATAAELLACQEAVRDVIVDDKVRKYVLDVVHATRRHEDVALGGSPRASIALFRTAQALAAVQGRDYVLPDDVKRLVPPVLGHRLILKPESRLRKVTPASVLSELLMDVSVPVLRQGDVTDAWAD